MSEAWTSWGDTGPIIGIKVEVTNSADKATINYEFLYNKRYNYKGAGIWDGVTTTATGYVAGELKLTKTFYPISNDDFPNNGVYILGSGTKDIYKTNNSQNISLTLSVDSWGGMKWNSISDNSKLRSISLNVSIPAIQRLSSPSITTSQSTIVPNNPQVTISWGAVDNASSYQLRLYSGSTSFLEWTSVNATSYTHAFGNIEQHRGKSITAEVYAQGSGNYASSATSSKTVAKVNTLPSSPTITQNGSSVTGSSSVSFNITPGSDSDGQSYTVYYKVKTSLVQAPSTLTIDLNFASQNQLPAGNNTILFYTFDGLEYSQAVSKTFSIEYAPVIKTHNEVFTTLQDGLGNKNLTAKVEMSFTLQSNLSTSFVELKAKSGPTFLTMTKEVVIPSNYYVYNSSNRTITLTLSQLPETYIDFGNLFQLQYTVSDGVLSSEPIPWTNAQKRANRPKEISSATFTNDAANLGIPAKTNYFKQFVKAQITLPTAEEGYLDIQKAEVVAVYSGQEKTFEIGKNEGETYNSNIDLSYILENYDVSLKTRVTDIGGQSFTSEVLSTFTRTSSVTYGGDSINLNITELRPLTNTQDLILKHPLAQASGTNTQDIQFLYKITTNNVEKPIEQEYISSSETPDMITVNIPANYIKQILIEIFSANSNIRTTATITVTAVDGFNAQRALLTTLIVNFTEPPILPDIDFKIRHDYNISGVISLENLGVEVPQYIQSDQQSQQLNIRMFSYQEGIIFMLPKATDPNSDISEYQIFLSRNDLIEIEAVKDGTNVSYGASPWLSIPVQVLQQVQDENYYYYRYSASQYTKNEYFYFKIRVRDSMGNFSSEKICNTFIIGARSVNPNFSVGNVEVIRQTDEIQHTDTVTLNYNLQILDLGGSATSSGWNRLYYEKFPNFEREQQNYIPEIFLQISICPSPDFTEDVYTVQTIKGNSPLLDYTSRQVIIENFPSSASKIYMKFELFVSYTTSNDSLAYLISIPSIFSYYGIVPTVAHRKHKIGINTSTIEQDEVFVVENYQGSRYVIFKGTDAQDASKIYTIQFDLLSGNIDGAIIDCGTWDE